MDFNNLVERSMALQMRPSTQLQDACRDVLRCRPHEKMHEAALLQLFALARQAFLERNSLREKVTALERIVAEQEAVIKSRHDGGP